MVCGQSPIVMFVVVKLGSWYHIPEAVNLRIYADGDWSRCRKAFCERSFSCWGLPDGMASTRERPPEGRKLTN